MCHTHCVIQLEEPSTISISLDASSRSNFGINFEKKSPEIVIFRCLEHIYTRFCFQRNKSQEMNAMICTAVLGGKNGETRARNVVKTQVRIFTEKMRTVSRDIPGLLTPRDTVICRLNIFHGIVVNFVKRISRSAENLPQRLADNIQEIRL